MLLMLQILVSYNLTLNSEYIFRTQVLCARGVDETDLMGSAKMTYTAASFYFASRP